jgi:pseudaminic acid cytidylyltransferase
MNIAIIPARGGSKRIPRKNIKDFLGKPMIAYAIETALKSNLFDKVIVSTDDKEIAEIAKKYGAEVPFIRPKELADDHAITVAVLSHSVSELKKMSIDAEYVCCIYPCTPMLSIQDLQDMFEEIKTKKIDFVYPIVEYTHPVFRAMSKTKENKMEFLFPENELVRTQDTKKMFHDAGQFYWGKSDAWLNNKRMHTDGIGFEIPAWRIVDIDTEDDWKRAELMYKMQNE